MGKGENVETQDHKLNTTKMMLIFGKHFKDARLNSSTHRNASMGVLSMQSVEPSG